MVPQHVLEWWENKWDGEVSPDAFQSLDYNTNYRYLVYYGTEQAYAVTIVNLNEIRSFFGYANRHDAWIYVYDLFEQRERKLVLGLE